MTTRYNPAKCKGLNGRGDRCGSYANGSGYCAVHSGRAARASGGKAPRRESYFGASVAAARAVCGECEGKVATVNCGTCWADARDKSRRHAFNGGDLR